MAQLSITKNTKLNQQSKLITMYTLALLLGLSLGALLALEMLPLLAGVLND